MLGLDGPHAARRPRRLLGRLRRAGPPGARHRLARWARSCSARILNLNETQSGVLAAVFKIADDNGLLLLDLKDLRALLQHAGDNAAQFRTQYGNISTASIGAIQRGLLTLESQGGEKFFGEPVARDRGPHADRGRPGCRQHPRRRQAPRQPARLRDHAAVAPVGALRAAARGGRPGEAEARLLLRRGAPALQRRARRSSSTASSRWCGWCAPRAWASSSSRRTRSTCPTPSSGSSATASSTRCAPSRRATRRPSRRPRPPSAQNPEARRREGDHRAGRSARRWCPSSTRRAGRVPWSARSSSPPRSRIGPITAEERAQGHRGLARSPGHYEKAVDRESAYEKLAARAGGRAEAGAAQAGDAQAGEAKGGGVFGGILDSLGLPGGAGARRAGRGRRPSKPRPRVPPARSAAKSGDASSAACWGPSSAGAGNRRGEPMAKTGERKAQILQTLASMLEEPKAERVTTALLAARLDVSEAALYRHFASKAQMFEGLIEFIEQTLFTPREPHPGRREGRDEAGRVDGRRDARLRAEEPGHDARAHRRRAGERGRAPAVAREPARRPPRGEPAPEHAPRRDRRPAAAPTGT